MLLGIGLVTVIDDRGVCLTYPVLTIHLPCFEVETEGFLDANVGRWGSITLYEGVKVVHFAYVFEMC